MESEKVDDDYLPEVKMANYITSDDKDVFQMISRPRGLCLIIDNWDYKNLSPRKGSDCDRKKLCHLFTKLGFKVDCVENLKTLGLQTKLSEFAKSPLHNDCDAAVLIILAHGGNGFVYGTNAKVGRDAENYILDFGSIMETLSDDNCVGLRKKPKVCIIQACQGDCDDVGVCTDGVECDSSEIHCDFSEKLSNVSELLIANSCQPGYAAYRHQTYGSFFIKNLVDVFATHSCERDLEDMLKIVENKMRNETVSMTREDRKRKMVLSTTYKAFGWTKKLFFNPGFYKEDKENLEKSGGQGLDDSEKALQLKLREVEETHYLFSEKCSKQLLRILTDQNCIRFYEFGIKHDLPDLELFQEFIVKDFLKVCSASRQDFLALSSDMLLNLISSEQLIEKDTDAFFQMLLDWLEHDVKNRKSCIGHLLNYVSLNKCSPKFLKSIQCRPLIRDTDFLSKSVKSAVEYFKVRQPIYVMGGFPDKKTTTKSVEVYDLSQKKWILHGDAEGAHCFLVALPLDGSVVVITPLKTFRWNPSTNQSEALLQMKDPRTEFGAAVLDRTVYVMGGKCNKKVLSTCLTYDVNENTWAFIPEMNVRREKAGVASLDGQIYCAGGYDGSSALNSVERFSPVRNTWTLIDDMIGPRLGFSLVTYQNSVYAFGGWDCAKCLPYVEKYTPSGKWEECPRMLVPRAGLTVVYHNNHFYAAGGITDSCEATPSTEISNLTSNKWTAGPDLSVGRFGHSSFVLECLDDEEDSLGSGNASCNKATKERGERV